MLIRDRIVELRRVKASQLRPNPRNWRTHPAAQQDALRGLLADSSSTVSTLVSAMHTLDQLGALQPADLVELLTHRDPAIRIRTSVVTVGKAGARAARRER